MSDYLLLQTGFRLLLQSGTGALLLQTATAGTELYSPTVPLLHEPSPVSVELSEPVSSVTLGDEPTVKVRLS